MNNSKGSTTGRDSANSGPVDSVTQLDTPEQIRFSYRLAGPAQRAMAYAIDLAVRGGLLAVVGVGAAIGGAIGSEGLAGLSAGVMAVILFAVEWGYYVVCETAMDGQSVGKRVLKLRVVKGNGLPIGLGDSLLRNLLRAADFLPGLYALGGLIMAADGRFRRLGDWASDTIVVVESRSEILPPFAIEPAPSQQTLMRLPARPDISPDELDAIEMLLRRSGHLNPVRELELAELVAPEFAQRMGLRYNNASRFLALLYHRATQKGMS